MVAYQLKRSIQHLARIMSVGINIDIVAILSGQLLFYSTQ